MGSRNRPHAQVLGQRLTPLIVPGHYVDLLQSEYAPQFLTDMVTGASAGKAQSWYDYVADSTVSQFSGIAAAYASGEYIVAGVSPDLPKTVPVEVGWRVVGVGGLAVDDYVHSRVGEMKLQWDPVARKVFARDLYLPPGETGFTDRAGDDVSLVLSSANGQPSPGFERWPALARNEWAPLYSATALATFG